MNSYVPIALFLSASLAAVPASWGPPQAIVGSEWSVLSDPLDAGEYAQGPPLAPVVSASVLSNATIFIGLAAFREQRCGRTVFEAFRRAKFPGRVFVGVVDQLAEGVDQFTCLDDYCRLATQNLTAGRPCPFREHVRVDRREARASRGPTLARYHQQQLLRNETFCLQLDSHSLFADGWDVALLGDWLSTRNEFAVLSSYIANIDQIDKQSDEINVGQIVPHICKTQRGGQGMVRNQQATAARALARPKLNTLWGAGLSFSKCHAEVVVPYDPHLDHVFDGEEFSRAVRLFTWGYDLYTPHRNRVFHDYTPVSHRWVAADGGGNYTRAIQRLHTLLLGEQPYDPDFDRFGRYGLGKCRTYEQAIAFTGVDPRVGTHSDGAQCGNLTRVPFKVSQECDAQAVYARHLRSIGATPSLDETVSRGKSSSPSSRRSPPPPPPHRWFAQWSFFLVVPLQVFIVIAVMMIMRANFPRPRTRAQLQAASNV
jgi:hypothetical protein